MKSLNDYVAEKYDETIIDEGLINWLKKFWGWLTTSTKENVEKNNGSFINSEKIQDSVKTGKIKEFKFAKINNEKFLEHIDCAKSKEKSGTFFNCYDFYLKLNKDEKYKDKILIFSFSKDEPLGYIFGIKNDEIINCKILINTSNKLNPDDDKSSKTLKTIENEFKGFISKDKELEKMSVIFDLSLEPKNNKNKTK